MLSVLIAVSSIGLWIRSGFALDAALLTRGEDPLFALGIYRGSVGAAWERYRIHRSPRDPDVLHLRLQSWSLTDADEFMSGIDDDSEAKSFLGFRFVPGFMFFIPFWLILVSSLVLPLTWWLRLRRSSARGLCRNCNYDLRATPNRCPECGTIPSRGRDG
jgi:hypothetical protein